MLRFFSIVMVIIFMEGKEGKTIVEREDEPRCYSRFDWEDKLLQKTIATDMKMDQQIAKIENLVQEIKGHNDELKEWQSILASASENLRNKVQEKLDEFRDWRRLEEDKVKQLIESMNTPTVAYNVRDAVQTTPALNDIIRFEKVLLNVGGDYDQKTGIFTVPVNGTYLFGAQVCTRQSKYGWFQIAVDAVDNIILLVVDFDADTQHSSGSGMAVIHLTKGQTVWLQNRHSSTSLFDKENSCWNQFTGVLLHI